MDLYTQINNLAEDNDSLIEDMVKHDVEAADAEQEYRVLKAKKILYIRANGQPASLAEALAEGDEEVAGAKFRRTCAEALSHAAQERINNNKKLMTSLESQLCFERSGRNE